MMYKVEYSKAADKTLRKWKKSNPALFKKATKVLFDIMQHPLSKPIYNHYSIRFSDDTFDEEDGHDELLVSFDKKIVEIIERLHNSDEFRAKWRA